MKKRIIPILLVLSVLLSSLLVGISAFAFTNSNIGLNTLYINEVNGADDKIWYSYTPSASGKYAFVSYTQSNEAYLFTKKDKMYTQIQYAGPSDPNYENNFRYFVDSKGVKDTTKKHYATTFYLECYLIKGTTYYFAAGYANETKTSGNVSVALYNLSVDDSEQVIESISVDCSTSLSSYVDGDWELDSDGNRYFFYNFSRLIQNMNITINNKDGSKVVIPASSKEYDGMQINFAHNQVSQHWYSKDMPEYVANTLTVSVGMISCKYEVQIEPSKMYAVKGKVVDYVTNEPIKNASIYIGSSQIATTDDKGVYLFAYPSGIYNIRVGTDSSIDYSFKFTVDTLDASANNQTSNPVKLINCDYVKDGIINAKDYALAKKNGYVYHSSVTNFTKDNY